MRLVAVVVCAAALPAAAGTLEAPQLTIKPQGALAAFTGESVDVLVGWRPVPGAAGYRVSIGSETTDTSELRFERKGLPIGRYALTVLAVDKDGSASPPSESVPLNVLEIRAIPPGATTSMPPARGAYAVGTRISVPGMHCDLGPVDPGAENELRMTTVGRATLRCVGAAGSLEQPIVVAPIEIASTSHAVRGGTSTVRVTLASVAFLGNQLDVEAVGDITLGDAHRTPFGIEVPVTAAADARTATLSVQAGDFELGRVALALDPAPTVTAAPYVPPDWRALDLGGHAGAFFPAATSALGEISAGPVVGARLGLFPTRRIGLEGELALIEAGHGDEGGSSHLLSARGSLAVRALETRRVGVRFLVGGGVIDTTPGGHGGVALTVETSPNLWLRFQFLDVVTRARDEGYAQGLEVQLGVVTRIGRRDSW